MPLYEYQCADCEHIFECMQKMSDPPPASCGKCGSSKISKLISQTAFVLKGGGWYNEGYASKAPAKGGDAPSAPANDTTKAKPAADAATTSGKATAKDSPSGKTNK